MTVVIRTPVAADADELGRMHLASWREAYGDFLPAWVHEPAAEEQRIAAWRRILADPRLADPHLADAHHAARAIAEEGGRIVGFAVAGPSRDAEEMAMPAAAGTELYSLYLLAAQHGSGLADRLLDAVLDPGPAQLWAFRRNARALAYYAKRGFAPDGATHDYGPDWSHEPAVRLVRP